MAWNQPGEENRRLPPRGAPDNSSLDEMLRRWHERVQRLWRPGSSRGRAALALVVLAAVVWLASGYYQIGAAERGVVQRFGGYVSTELPGSGWHWPWPIETLTKVNVTNVRGVDAKAMVLTADQSLINIGWSVQYRVGDPLRYLFQLRDPEGTLHQTSETVIRELAAHDDLQSLLSGDARARLSGQARARIQQMLDSYQSGIHISSVNLTDVELPEPVVASQHDADRAAAQRARELGEAQTYASTTVAKAEDQAQRELSDAQLYATRTVASAQGDAERFDALAGAYALSPQVTRDRLYIDAVNDILSHTRKIFVDARGGTGTMIYVPLDKLAEAMHNAAPAGQGSSTPTEQGSAAGSDSGAEAVPSDRQGEDDRSRARGGR